ncbi:MAG: GAF domain-containing protein [Chloroflexi bacterium]|nr:GAF domain-containing protein [Chloroflexota bacterium]
MNSGILREELGDRTLPRNRPNPAIKFFEWATRPHPSLPDELTRRRSQLLAAMIGVLVLVSVAGLFISYLQWPDVPSKPDYWLFVVATLIVIGAFGMNRSGRVDLAAGLVIVILGMTFTIVPFLPGAENDYAFFAALPILATAIFFSARASVLTMVFITIWMAIQISAAGDQPWSMTFFLAVTGGVIYVFTKHVQYQEGLRTKELEVINRRLRASEESLEHRVQERTRDLQVAADVSLQITTMLDRAELLADVAERTAGAFNLYHVSIFLYDETQRVIRLHQGVGEAGDQMVKMGKQFHMGHAGLVPQAARTRQAALSNNVLQDPRHLPNPLLPDSRAELAIPMLYQGNLIGVLDLQSQQVNRFSDEDIRILKTLADQIAIAVRNSQLFEQTVAALAQAERANSVKSAFLASMSHELRTPLNAIINFTKFVAKGMMGPVNDEQIETLNEVIDSAKHLLNLINDVLDMSKIEAGSLNLFVEPGVDLNVMLKTLMATGKTLLADKPVDLRLEVDAPLPAITGDRQRILQVLLNVLSNACKFTEEGRITIQARHVDDEVFFAIEDTGPGIAPEDQPLVFEAFKQTETGLRQRGGTGLGMPISRSLVEAHGGRLWLESEPGKGTIFYVALPALTESPEPFVIL